MGCLCSESTLEEFAEFELVILKLLPTDESTPNTFTITQITETILPKEQGKTLFNLCETNDNTTISGTFKFSSIQKSSLFYIYLRKSPVIKKYKTMKDFKPSNFCQLHKIIILLTEEANNKNITNDIIKKQTYQIDSLISKQIDFTEEINKQKEMNNSELTDDSFELSNIEDYEDEPSPEQNESEYVIEGVVNTNSLNKLKSILQESVVKTETKEEIITTVTTTNKNAQPKDVKTFESEEIKQSTINNNPQQNTNSLIRKITFRNAKIPKVDIFSQMIDLLKDHRLKSFKFSENQIDADFGGWLDIFNLIDYNTHIRSINLSNSRFYDEHVEELVRYLKGKRIRALTLSENFLSEQSAIYLSKWLSKNKTLQKLDLQRNAVTQFRAEGVKYLTDALLTHPNIQIIDLSFMELTRCGASLAELIEQSKSLQSLGVHATKLNYGDFKAICRATINSESLTMLDIGMNYLGGDKSIEEIANMIKSNSVLREINLDNIGLNMENYQVLFNAFQENDKINKVYISYNSDMKIKVMVNFFKERDNIKYLEYVPYEPNGYNDKKITAEEKRVLERVKKERPDMTFIYE